MTRARVRLRIDDEGRLEVVDPGFDSIALLRSVDPDFRVRRAPLDGFVFPRLRRTRAAGSGLPTAALGERAEESLWRAHARAVGAARDEAVPARDGEASLLDLKIELARRVLTSCRLCAHRCRVDRTRGPEGVCRLGMGAIVAERFVHIAEEAPINPSLLLSLAGCGMRCRFCQQGDLLDPSSVSGEPVEPLLWRRLRCRGARSLSFAGGNPDESLYGVLRFLRAAPEDWALPLVWNCHGFGTRETVALLDGVVDVYVPDFKYGSSACARRLSGCAGYPSAARASVRRMLAQGAVVIARVLVLPGHLECCHLPALRMLSAMSDSRLQVSIRGQYAPDWKVVPGEGLLGRRATEREVASVREAAIEIGLTLVE